MAFDPIVANAGRLRILTALVSEPRQEFVRLRQLTRLTDGNLATHARRLEGAGLIAIDKSIRAGKPVTDLRLTLAGRAALEAHALDLLSVLHRPLGDDGEDTPHAVSPARDDAAAEDDWID